MTIRERIEESLQINYGLDEVFFKLKEGGLSVDRDIDSVYHEIRDMGNFRTLRLRWWHENTEKYFEVTINLKRITPGDYHPVNGEWLQAFREVDKT